MNVAGKTALEQVEREYYDLDRILQWHTFGSTDKLIDHAEAVLKRLG